MEWTTTYHHIVHYSAVQCSYTADYTLQNGDSGIQVHLVYLYFNVHYWRIELSSKSSQIWNILMFVTNNIKSVWYLTQFNLQSQLSFQLTDIFSSATVCEGGGGGGGVVTGAWLVFAIPFCSWASGIRNKGDISPGGGGGGGDNDRVPRGVNSPVADKSVSSPRPELYCVDTGE